MPIVTVGISFYKDKDTLSIAVRSVLKQTFTDWELILMDDGSSDGSLQIAQEFVYDKRIKVISDGENKGLPSRLNEMIKMANGKYFARMDADDIMMPNRIEEQIKYLESHPDTDVLGTGAYSISIDNVLCGRKKEKIPAMSPKDVFKTTLVMHPTVMARTSWFRDNKYCESKKRAQDYELWCRTAPYSKFYNLKQPLMMIREGNSINKDMQNQLKQYTSKLDTIVKYGPSHMGITNTVVLSAEAICKYIVYYSLYKTGLLSFFINKILSNRYILLDEDELKEKQSFIKELIND